VAEDSKSALSHFCTLSSTRGPFDENTCSPASEHKTAKLRRHFTAEQKPRLSQSSDDEHCAAALDAWEASVRQVTPQMQHHATKTVLPQKRK